MPLESVCYQGGCWGSSRQMISAWSAETHVAIRFQQSKTSVIRLHAMPKLLASMEKTPCMNEDDHIKQFLRFTSEDELIRLAEIGLAVEMHEAAQRFFTAGRMFPRRTKLRQNANPTSSPIQAAHARPRS